MAQLQVQGRAKNPDGPEEPYVIAGEDTQSLSQEEAELELLRQFDLAWQYGPCTGENPTSSPSDTSLNQFCHRWVSETIQVPAQLLDTVS